MSDKTYTLEVSETELARVMFVIGKVNGLTEGKSVYSQAYSILGIEKNEHYEIYHALHGALGTKSIDYNSIQEEWEIALGVGESKKSAAQQRIENLEKELDELKKLL